MCRRLLLAIFRDERPRNFRCFGIELGCSAKGGHFPVRKETMPKVKLTASMGLLSCVVLAQSGAIPPPEPEAIGIVYYLDSTAQKLVPLPIEQYKAVGHAKGLGFGGATGVLVLEGPAAAVRIPSADGLAMVVRVSNPELAKLYLFTRKKKTREVELARVGFAGTSQKISHGLALVVTKYGESSFKLTPESRLDPGEYAIDMPGGKIFTFGIDASR